MNSKETRNPMPGLNIYTDFCLQISNLNNSLQNDNLSAIAPQFSLYNVCRCLNTPRPEPKISSGLFISGNCKLCTYCKLTLFSYV